MSKEIFIDTDIILDLLCKREPFYPYAAEVFTMGDKGLLTNTFTSKNTYDIL